MNVRMYVLLRDLANVQSSRCLLIPLPTLPSCSGVLAVMVEVRDYKLGTVDKVRQSW